VMDDETLAICSLVLSCAVLVGNIVVAFVVYRNYRSIRSRLNECDSKLNEGKHTVFLGDMKPGESRTVSVDDFGRMKE